MAAYDYIVVGGGVTGILVAEMLTRSSHHVLLVEKNEKLASGSSAQFHEWFHQGSLYSLVPGQLDVAKYVLGATDDLFKYYDNYNLNLGLRAGPGQLEYKPPRKNCEHKAWFTNRRVKFNMDTGSVDPLWSAAVGRASSIIQTGLQQIDWSRRHGGDEGSLRWSKLRAAAEFRRHLNASINGDTYSIDTPELFMNSRAILSGILAGAMMAEIKLGVAVTKVWDNGYVEMSDGVNHMAKKRVIVCSGESLPDLLGLQKISTSYAPIAVCRTDATASFVNLYRDPNRCSNLILKDDGVAMVGGLSYSSVDAANRHLDQIIRRVQDGGTKLDVLGTYLGEKHEVALPGKRNYVYNIWDHSDKVMVAVPGKFTMAFSVAPEVARRVTGYGPCTKNHVDNGSMDGFRKYLQQCNWDLIANGDNQCPVPTYRRDASY